MDEIAYKRILVHDIKWPEVNVVCDVRSCGWGELEEVRGNCGGTAWSDLDEITELQIHPNEAM